MRYVIVSVVKGKAGQFNDKIRRDVFKKFKLKSSKLPAHFTIKSPFEYDGDIIELEECIENFIKKEKRDLYILDGYDHFDDRVIYMKVYMSKEGRELHDRLIGNMKGVSYINFDDKDLKDKVFHVTVTSKKVRPLFKEAFNYVKEYPYRFDCYFDNICIYKWENNIWKLHKEFNIKK